VAFNIADLFEYAVDAVPDRTALVIAPRRLSFTELDEQANRLANHLLSEGFGHGDHIGIYGQNSVEWVVAMLAAFKIRAVPININFRYVEDELLYLFDNADLVGLVYARAYAPRVAAVRNGAPGLRHLIAVEDGSGEDITPLGSMLFDEVSEAASPDRPDVARSPDDHYVLYTGGTTGMPKGVVWRHEDVLFALGGCIDAYTNERVASATALADKARASASPLVSLNAPPLMHGAAQWGALRFLFEGNTVVFLPKFTPEAVWTTVNDEDVNTISITGDAMARPMIETLEQQPDRWNLSSLMVVSSSAAIFSPTVKDRYLELLPNLMIIDAIGSSESGVNGMAVQGKGQTATHGGGGPTVVAGRDAVVLDDDLRPLPPGSGVVGKLARGGNLPLGYYKDPVKTAATFVTSPDGERYVVAGDYATLEDDGTITLLGRGSVCINSGGEKIYPEEVEAALKAHPSVFDTIVVGVPDERWGQAVAAVVEPRKDVVPPTLADLDAHSRTRLAAYKTPRHLVLVDQIVRSPSGKPDYPWATRLAAEHMLGPNPTDV
jgi:acyl-CoA synthetase (AMP-forming)/AMP-acid ligase II